MRSPRQHRGKAALGVIDLTLTPAGALIGVAGRAIDGQTESLAIAGADIYLMKGLGQPDSLLRKIRNTTTTRRLHQAVRDYLGYWRGVRRFIDTDFLAYADSADAPAKQACATAPIAEQLRDGSGVISRQVLQELVKAAIRKLALPLEIVRGRVWLCGRFETVNASSAAVLNALDLPAVHHVSFWDTLILHAARQSGCVQLLDRGSSGRRRDGRGAHRQSV